MRIAIRCTSAFRNGQIFDGRRQAGADSASPYLRSDLCELVAVRASAERGAATTELHPKGIMNAVAMQSVSSQRWAPLHWG